MMLCNCKPLELCCRRVTKMRTSLALQKFQRLALVLCVIQLFVWGLLVGRAIGRGWTVAFVVAIGDSLLGLLIVSLKVLVIH